jgi:hypothetical protein
MPNAWSRMSAAGQPGVFGGFKQGLMPGLKSLGSNLVQKGVPLAAGMYASGFAPTFEPKQPSSTLPYASYGGY